MLGQIFLTTSLLCSQISNAQDFKWVNPIGGTGVDRSNASATDAAGNVYVTGYFSGTVDFNPSGAVANLVATGTQDAFIVKYNSAGAFVWAKSIGGIGNNSGTAIAVDVSGDLLVGGYFSGTANFNPGVGIDNRVSNGMTDLFVLKLDNAGNYKWAITLGDIYSESVSAIKTDKSGNIFVGGLFSGHTDFDPSAGTATLDATQGGMFFAKYEANGNYKWAKNIGCNGGSQYLNAMALDTAGNIYLAGAFNGPADFDPGPASFIMPSTSSLLQDAFIARYDTGGNYVWAYHMGCTDDVTTAYGLALGKSGTINIVGVFYSTVDFDPGSAINELSTTVPAVHNIFIAQYDLMGNYKWAKNIGSSTSGGGAAKGSSISIDSSDNMYITGYFSGTTDFDPSPAVANITAKQVDMFFAKYDITGNYKWAHSIVPTTGIIIGGIVAEPAVTVDSKGSIYLTGSFVDTVNFNPFGIAQLSSLGNHDGFIAKYNDFPTSINDVSAQSSTWSVYPNPAGSYLTIHLDRFLAEDATIHLFNTLGQTIVTIQNAARLFQHNELNINLKQYALTPGTYYVQLVTKKETMQQQFIVH